jgi:hypothetical protein
MYLVNIDGDKKLIKTRKSPVRHRVRSHTRQNRPVRSYTRGHGRPKPKIRKKKVNKVTMFKTSNLSELDRVDREVVRAVVRYGNMKRENPMELWGGELVNFVYSEVTTKLGYGPVEQKLESEGYTRHFDEYVDWSSEWVGDYIRRE